MFYTVSDRMFSDSAENRRDIPLHGDRSQQPEQGQSAADDVDNNEGMWGERDVGGPVNHRAAMQEFEDMRKDLSSLSRTRTNRTEKSAKSVKTKTSGLGRIVSAGRAQRSQPTADTVPDVEANGREEEEEAETAPEDDEDFELDNFLKDGHFEKRQSGKSAKKVGVVYKNLTVQG